MAHAPLCLFRVRQSFGRPAVHHARFATLLPPLFRRHLLRVLRRLRRAHRSRSRCVSAQIEIRVALQALKAKRRYGSPFIQKHLAIDGMRHCPLKSDLLIEASCKSPSIVSETIGWHLQDTECLLTYCEHVLMARRYDEIWGKAAKFPFPMILYTIIMHKGIILFLFLF